MPRTTNFSSTIIWMPCLILLLACQPPSPDGSDSAPSVEPGIRIFAASGIRPMADEICDRFQDAHGLQVERNYASSGTLARQLALGANADIFISANRQWMDYLQKQKILKPGSIQKIARNSLALIAPKERKHLDIQFSHGYRFGPNVKHIAIGDPAYVPVGRYTNEMIQALGWEAQLNGKLVLAKDVSSVLHYVELGEVDLGVVYRSEAMGSDKVELLAEIPPELHSPIIFYAAEVDNGARQSGIAAALVNQMATDSRKVLKKYGFIPLKASRKNGTKE